MWTEPMRFSVPEEVHRKKMGFRRFMDRKKCPRSLPSHSLQMRTRSNFDSIKFADAPFLTVDFFPVFVPKKLEKHPGHSYLDQEEVAMKMLVLGSGGDLWGNRTRGKDGTIYIHIAPIIPWSILGTKWPWLSNVKFEGKYRNHWAVGRDH